jgi:hypothetical protein
VPFLIVIVGVFPVLLVTLNDLIMTVSTAPELAIAGVNKVVSSVVATFVPKNLYWFTIAIT